MEALCFGSATSYWHTKPQNGTGPWIMADVENGVYPGNDSTVPPPIRHDYVTAILKGHRCEYAMKGGDSQTGKLTTYYDGIRPQHGRYNPMRKEGSIIMGTGGDNSNGAVGIWNEEAMMTGYDTAAVDDALQASIVALLVGIGK